MGILIAVVGGIIWAVANRDKLIPQATKTSTSDSSQNQNQNSSQDSSVAQTTTPKLDQISPTDNYSTSDDKVTVSGQTDSGNKVSINNQEISVDSDGKFSQVVVLNPGTNRISIIATDKNGVENKVGLIYEKTATNPAATNSTTTTSKNSNSTTSPQNTPIRTGGFDATFFVTFVITVFILIKFTPRKSKL